MALYNTSDRYKYIYGNNARTAWERTSGSAVPKPDKRSRRQKKKPYMHNPGQTGRLSAAEQARIRRKHERSQVFDRRMMIVATISLMMVVFFAITYVRGWIQLNNLSGQITELKIERSRMLSRQDAIRTDIDKSVDLDEIYTYATEKLHMVYPDQEHVIYFNSSTDDYFRQYESVSTDK